MEIKRIFDEIANTSGNNAKMDVLRKYKDNQLLQKVLYLIKSKRVKFFIKQIPEYTPWGSNSNYSLSEAVNDLKVLSNREETGQSAVAYLKQTLENLSTDDAYIIERIIDKDPKIGLGRTFINKVIPNLIEKTPYQGAKSFSEKLARKIFKDYGYAYSDVKMDGRYANAIIQSGQVEFESRQGETTYIPVDSLLIRELSKFGDGVLNGELTIINDDGSTMDRYTSNGIIASIVDIEGCGKMGDRNDEDTSKKLSAFRKKHGDFKEAVDKIRYTVWDSITLEDYFNKKSDIEYRKRLDYLFKKTPILECTRVAMVERLKVYSYEEAMTHFQKILLRGEEGTILKAPLATWKDSKPPWQVKMKLEMNIDLRVVSFEYGDKGTKNEDVYSRINLESSCGELKTKASGMSEAMMKDITNRADELIGTVVEIRCCGLSQNSNGDWSTLHPSVVELRDDKDTCDSLESAKEIEAMAKGLTKALS
jgi:ATP-dependent DNA ligase